MLPNDCMQAATEFRFESVPELKYDAEADPPAGEILIRGPLVSAPSMQLCMHVE
jgi:hypothetical protein